MRITILSLIAWSVSAFLSVAQSAEKEKVSADEQAVIDALARSVPGDTIVVKPGFYRGGWKLKAGLPDKPITLKAERAGRVFIGSVETHVGFEPVAGAVYSFSKPFTAAPPKMRELDTAKDMRWMATPMDVEEVVGSYCFDEETKRLYIHPTDSAGVEHHTYATISTTNGITLADHTVVDGFVMSGFGSAALFAPNGTGVVVQNCKLYRNGSAISLGKAKNCVVRNNECWENSPDYSQSAQIYMQDGTEGTLVEGNFVHHGFSHTGIFIYGENRNNTYRRNIVWGAQGLAIKGRDNSGDVSEYNVTDGFVATLGMRSNTGYRSDDALGRPDAGSDLLAKDLPADPKYADPAWADCRLQSDSPARGKARDGKDLGALPYQGDVLFVKPDGNDAAAGTSVVDAWRTLAHATKTLQAGQTLYILPGHYAEPLVLRDKQAAAGRKTLVRVHGKARATVQRIEIQGCTSLEVAHVAVQGSAGPGVRIAVSQRLKLLSGSSYLNQGAGVEVVDCREVSLERCALWKNDVGLSVARSDDVELVSSLVGENRQAQVVLGPDVKNYFGEFNAYRGATLGQASNERASDIAGWRKLSGQETHSLELTDKLAGPEQGDFRVAAGTALMTAGLYESPIGPQSGFVARTTTRRRIERVEVVSVTRTSANLLWYTPGRMAGTALQWGLTKSYGETHDRSPSTSGEYELVHTVSLVGLQPNTTYHFRPGSKDNLADETEIAWDDRDYTFTTATTDPEPRQLFVATQGSDAHDGLTPQTAWKTLHKAAREARAGDTVTIAPGRYVELLRPLQTGTSDERRITFRAEKPLSVFLEGGLIKFVRTGRPHDVQLHTKAFITIENLTGMFCSEGLDYGGYRGGWGYAGIFRVSGGCMNEFKGCVADARYRWMSGFVFFDAGIMPGMPEPKYAGRISDSATLACWRGVQGIVQRAPLILDHNVYYVSLTGMYSINGGEKWISRSCIYQDLVGQKRSGAYPLYWTPQVYDSDYACFAWMPQSGKYIAKHEGKELNGLEAWQTGAKRDLHSIEYTPDYGLTPLEQPLGFNLRPLTIEDFILPRSSPLRGQGEHGSDIGVRWEKFLAK
ncbi:MAG: right-handed parallel beta-helix repeat-containing protein [Planctomycetia bacterium]|nr:right-handed parallel beta-helix repeat-containing protein [Planctomycetia bacterium]